MTKNLLSELIHQKKRDWWGFNTKKKKKKKDVDGNEQSFCILLVEL